VNAETAPDIASWFDRYIATFTAQASGAGPDSRDLLLRFYATPMSLTVPDRHVVVTNSKLLAEAVDHDLSRLREQGYAGSSESGRTIRVLSEDVTLIETSWVRHNRDGGEIERLDCAYLVVPTDSGWQFGSIVVTPTVTV
jgi:hypothetical protein